MCLVLLTVYSAASVQDVEMLKSLFHLHLALLERRHFIKRKFHLALL